MKLLEYLTRLINALTALVTRTPLGQLQRLEALYRPQSDEELRAALAEQFQRTPDRAKDRAKLLTRSLFRYSETPELHALAIGLCLFDRYPCDLPSESTAYEEQRLAALSLMSGLNVQMDTGEGKTYAIALSAVALLAEYPQVLVITANEYLARRDLARVRPFLDACGLASGYGIPDTTFRGISYLTVDALCVEYLKRTYFARSVENRGYPAGAAVIIDEIDSVTIDRSLDHRLVRPLATDEELWRSVFDFARCLHDDDYTYDPIRDQIDLSADTWELVSRLGTATAKPTSLLLDLVTAALWALRAQEGRNYALTAGQILLVNRVTGALYTSSGTYAQALEHHVLGRSASVALTVARIDGLTLLSRHPHVVGLSGTTREDTLYYLQTFGTLTASIPPRFPRNSGRITTTLSPNREETFRHIARRIASVAPRPVVIGTWSPEEAESVSAYLVEAATVSGSRPSVITAFDSDVDRHALDLAGEPGQVTVLSQGGSRGVDVRSQHRPLLIILGHAYEPRLDRQFLGRVGRHGEAFDAEFVIDPNSPIWNKALAFHANKFGLLPLNRTTARALKAAQRDSWAGRTQSRQQRSILSKAIAEGEQQMAASFARGQRVSTSTTPSDWASYLGELESAKHREDPAGEAGAQSGGTPSAGKKRALAAMKRRIASDEFVSQLEKAITAVDPAEWSTHRQRTMQGDPEEIATLTAWIEARRQEVAQHSDARTAMLFREQVKIAAEQRLPAPSSPHWRSAEQVVHETLLMTNADRIEEAERRLRSLWVSSSRPVYYRRGAYTVQNIDKMSQIALRQELLKNLAAVDDPGQLDELFFSYDHMLLRPNDEKGGETSFQLAGSASGADHGKTSSTVDDVIRAFLDEYAKRPGGLPIPVQSASAMLRAVTRPFLDGPGTVTGALLRRQVDLVVQSLASAGIRGRQLRDHERMIEAHLVSLHEKGLLPVPLPRRWRATGAAHRVAGFASTVPRWGLAALAGLCCVLALGFAIHGTEGRRFQSILVAARLFGFGSVLEDRPLLMFFAAIIVAYAVMHAVGHPSALTVLPRVGPLIALVLALALYARSVRGVGIALVAFLIFAVWGNVFFAMERLVATLVGAQATLVFAAASVITFAVLLVKEGGNPGVLGPLGIGIIAALWGGPSVPVTVGSTSFSGGRFRHSDDRARVRVPLDPALLSCVVAAALVALDFGVRGIGELISFAAIQAVVFALFARRRLRGDRVEKALAGLRVGTPLEHVELLRYLRRALLISVLVGVAVIGGCIAVALLSGVRTLSMVVLSELAGVLLVEGLLSLSSAMSVAGVGAPFLVESEADRGRNFLAERFRNWNQLRFAWAIKAGLIVLVLVKPLEWFSNWTGLADAAKSLWHLVTSLF